MGTKKEFVYDRDQRPGAPMFTIEYRHKSLSHIGSLIIHTLPKFYLRKQTTKDPQVKGIDDD